MTPSPNNSLDRMTRSAVAPLFQVMRPRWPLPRAGMRLPFQGGRANV
jgi:hypothetical protein